MRNTKTILLIITFIALLSSCGSGGASSSDSNIPQVKTESFSIDGQDINSIMLHTIGKTSVAMINNSTTPLTITNIKLDNESDVIESSSTCLNKTLNQNETCNIDLTITGVYTAKTNVAMTLTTNKGIKSAVIPVFNYNYTNNLSQNKKLEINALTDQYHAFDDGAQEYVIFGKPFEDTITLTNIESSPLYIESISYENDLVHTQPNMIRPNHIILEKSSCNIGTTLLGGQSCNVTILNNALSPNSDINYIDRLKIKFAGINEQNVVKIKVGMNASVIFGEEMLNVYCDDIPNCPVKFNGLGYKIVLDSIQIMYEPKGTTVTQAGTESPCYSGVDLTGGFCNLNVSLTGDTVIDEQLWIMGTVKIYIDDTNYIKASFDNTKGVLDLRNFNIQSPTVETNNLDMITSFIDENNTFVQTPNIITISNNRGGVYPIQIKAIRVTPSATNFMSIDNNQLITAESMIYADNCTGTILERYNDISCELKLLVGQNGYGSAGTLEIDYSINGGETQTLTKELGSIAQAKIDVSVNNPEPNNPNMVQIWKSGDKVQPIYVNTSKISAGFTIGNGNTNSTGSYVLIDYKGDYKSILPNCRAWVNEMGGYMYNGYFFCGYELDFSKNNIGDVIQTELILGNHKEIRLPVFFKIVN